MSEMYVIFYWNYLCQHSQAVRVGPTVYISGQLGLVPSSMKLIEGGVVPEARQALQNMGEILKEAGGSFSNGELIIMIYYCYASVLNVALLIAF